jgi:hypothetical protein
VPPIAETGIPPTEATEKNPVTFCSDPSSGERTWISVCAEADKIRAWGVGSVTVWYGANLKNSRGRVKGLMGAT